MNELKTITIQNLILCITLLLLLSMLIKALYEYFKKWESKKAKTLKEKIRDEIRIAEVLKKDKEFIIKIRSMGGEEKRNMHNSSGPKNPQPFPDATSKPFNPSKKRIRIKTKLSDFSFTQSGYGAYMVTYTSPVTGIEWKSRITDMQIIDATKNSDSPLQKNLDLLKRKCKRDSDK